MSLRFLRRLSDIARARIALIAFAKGFLHDAIVALLKRARVRFVTVTYPDRIGHLAIEPDALLKDLSHKGLRRTLIMLEPARVANPCLLDYWRQWIWVVQSPRWINRLEPFRSHPHLNAPVEHYAVAMHATAEAYAVYKAWGSQPPLLRLGEQHLRRGRDALYALGIPRDAWFVCVHAREGGYSPSDEHFHRYRNVDIVDFFPAMEAIVARGGWCVRMGDSTMKPLPAMPGVVDYVHSALRSDWMDVFLCAECRFFMGTSSGLFLMSSVFGKPSAVANMAPMSAAYAPGINDISIPKLVQRRSSEPLSFASVLAGPVGNYRYADDFEREGIELVDNSPEELRELAVEMLDRLEGRAAYSSKDDELQRRFRALFRPGHYAYGAGSRIGRDFLRRHAALLEDKAREPNMT